MKKESALNYFNNGYNCSQAIIGSYAEEYGLDVELVSKMAVAFGGGMGRQGKVCGCLSGALMVLGLRHGNNSTEDINARINAYDIAKEFCSRFSEINGGIDCKDIIKYNLNNLEERKEAQDRNIFKTRCTEVVANTIELLEASEGMG